MFIIGFGISGISTARWAHKANLKFIVLEKNNHLGGCWYNKSYPNVLLQTDKHSYCFSDMPHDKHTQKFPSRTEILQYLSLLNIKNISLILSIIIYRDNI